eukprot:m.31115 g.31115  ORF g.31115 m.31115 type:complete len:158 (-) comp41603_c0_seq1:595-1068(-)
MYPFSAMRSASALHNAADGHEAVLKWFLSLHPPYLDALDKENRTAVMRAVINGVSVCTSLLIDAGANLLVADLDGRSALMLAVVSGHTRCTDLLLRGKADARRADNNGQTALMMAAQLKRSSCCKLLLDAGAAPQISSYVCSNSSTLDPMRLLIPWD